MEEREAQLEWEARAGRLAAYAAWVAAALIVAAIAYRIAALPRGADNVKDFLPNVDANATAFLVSGVLTALGMLAFIAPLLYLYRATRFRRHELPEVSRILIVGGPVLFAVSSVWFQLRQQDAADRFLAGANKTNAHAEDLLREATALVAGLSLAASIAVGLGTLLVSLNAMRAGLLSRFMGVLGVILGGLFVLPLIASPIIQLFWLTALGALFYGRWPGGRSPAWETGEQIPWPSAQKRSAAPADETDGASSAREVEAADQPAEIEADAAPAESAPAPKPRGSRKRKKRNARR